MVKGEVHAMIINAAFSKLKEVSLHRMQRAEFSISVLKWGKAGSDYGEIERKETSVKKWNRDLKSFQEEKDFLEISEEERGRLKQD